jgi:gliding motility-associated-like protein
MGKSKIRITQMLKRLLSVLTCTIVTSFCGELLAQIPEIVRMSNKISHRTLSPLACADQNAGSTVRSLGVGAKTNDKHFLCAGDGLIVTHNRDQNLSNDPNLTTPAGIVYGFYDCNPKISGPTLNDIKTDPCFNRQQVLLGNVLITPPLGFWVTKGTINGDVQFKNDGTLQRLYGGNSPKKFYFAPITIDNFDERLFEGNNSCVNANIRDIPSGTDTFSVVYLNKILEKNISYNYGTSAPFSGQFTVTGGLSEYDGTASYTMTVKKKSDNAIVGTATSGVLHNGVVNVSVPQSGTYTVTIVDGKACDRTFEMNFPVLQLLVLNDTVPKTGDIGCVKIAARGFNKIISTEVNFNYDKTLLKYVKTDKYNLAGMDATSFSNPTPGIITMTWSTPTNATVADSIPLFEVCFETLGAAGSFSSVKIPDTLLGNWQSPRLIEVYADNPDAANRQMGVSVVNGGVFIGNRAFVVGAQTDSVRCSGGSDGRIVVSVVGGAAPYTYNWTGPNGTTGNGAIPKAGDLLISNRIAGNYAITVTDAANLQKGIRATIGEPATKVLEKKVSYNYGTLTGQFTATGGLSEADGTSVYTITVKKKSDNTVVGTATSGVKHNGTVNVSVPQTGTYTINMVDGSSCSRSFEMHFPVLQLIVLNDTVPKQGDTSCVKVAARGFNKIISADVDFHFNHTLLKYVKTQHYNLPGMDANAFTNSSAGVVTMSWAAPTNATRADSIPLFELCFETKNSAGSFSDVTIADTLLTNWLNARPIDIPYDNPDGANRKMGVTLQNGGVFIGNRAFAVSTRTDSVPCYGGFNGRVAVYTVGGVAPYTYKWDGPSGANGNGTITKVGDSLIIGGRAAGNYTITVTDGFGARKIVAATVGEPTAQLYATLGTTNLRCFGDTTGALKILTTGGGTAPYRFSWSNSNDSIGASISHLRAGNYGATVADAHNCTYPLSGTIGVPQLVLTGKSSDDAVCVGISSGVARVTSVTGGTIPNGKYDFQWSNNVAQRSGTKDSIVNLSPGKYYVTVSDNNGCPVKDSFSIGLTRQVALTAIQQQIDCAGQNSGALNVRASADGGSERAPYTFAWSNNVGTPTTTSPTSVVTRLSGGIYTLTVKDADGCRLDTAFTITAPDSIKIDTQGVRHETCLFGGDGFAQISVKGGRPDKGIYHYLWNRGANDTLNHLSGLVAGNYTVKVTDSVGCTASKVVTILIPQNPIISRIDTVRPTCYNLTNGRLVAVAVPAAGGGAIKSYKWSTGMISDTLSNIGGGVYSVTVTDANGCTKVDSQRLSTPLRIEIDTIQRKLLNPTCPGSIDGRINIPVKGGAGAPYTYTSSTSQTQTGSVFAGLPQGHYVFKISDKNKCSITDSFDLKDPDSIRVRFSNPKTVSCFGDCNINRGNGAMTAQAYGGTSKNGKYAFVWSSNETTPNDVTDTSRAIALCQGKQFVTITDDQKLCFITYEVTVPTQDSFRFDSLVIVPPACSGQKNGSASIQVTGATPPFQYAWTGNISNSSAIANVGVGNYTLVVKDKNLCMFSIGLTINEPDPLKIDTVRRITNNATCHGLTDGQIGVRRTGGNAGRTTFEWSTQNGIDSIASDLTAGSYRITATDVKGCRDSMIYTVTQPDPIFFFMQKPAPPRCNSFPTTIKVDTAYGSTGRYPFLVSIDNGTGYPTGYSISTFAGLHHLNIIETTTGCTIDTTITISEPPPVLVDFDSLTNNPGQVHLKVGLGDSLRLNPRITSLLPIDSVVWSPKTYLSFKGDPLRPFVKPYDDITYKLTVFDANGCEGFDEVVVELERNRNVFVPNVFSPNGDDKNDFFLPFTGLGVVRVNYMRVFDRWGELIYSLQNLPAGQDTNIGWDGTFRGKKAESGVYVYLMEVVFEDGQVLLYRGDVNLLR